MVFNSYEFVLEFLPVACVVYFLLARSPRWGTWWLVVASLFFYAYHRSGGLWLLIASVLFNYGISLLLHRADRRKRYLVAGVLVNLLLLSLFKYRPILANLAAPNQPWFSLLSQAAFPLGISFFTFSQISYLVDTYRGQDRPAGLRNYALFVTFFPHLLSGPILRHRDMIPQFDSLLRRRPLPRYLARGAALIVIGLVKKVWIADPLAPLVARAFDSTGPLDPGVAWLGTLAYTFQLYNDFSGYADIAVGVAFLFNIRIPENFRAPYRSTSIQEFWRRWHISLSNWLRDYVYFALPGVRSKWKFVPYLNAVITMAVCGLWHGAGWTFLVWGLLHGFAVAACAFWRRLRWRMPNVLGWALTFTFVMLSWVVFRASDLAASVRVFRSLFSAVPWTPLMAWWRASGLALVQRPLSDWSLDTDFGRLVLLVAVLLVAVPSYSFLLVRRMKPSPWTACLGAVLLTACVLRFSSVTHFLYYFF
ncbi:MAG: MBOAT family protein [Acidobacteriia bacterium]|nr:MBOAT family protein [Terriglobia bacterium]